MQILKATKCRNAIRVAICCCAFFLAGIYYLENQSSFSQYTDDVLLQFDGSVAYCQFVSILAFSNGAIKLERRQKDNERESMSVRGREKRKQEKEWEKEKMRNRGKEKKKIEQERAIKREMAWKRVTDRGLRWKWALRRVVDGIVVGTCELAVHKTHLRKFIEQIEIETVNLVAACVFLFDVFAFYWFECIRAHQRIVCFTKHTRHARKPLIKKLL